MLDEITSGTWMHTVLGLQVCAGILRQMPQTLPFQQPKFTVLRLQVYASPPGSCSSVAPKWTISLLVVIFFLLNYNLFFGGGPTPGNNGPWHWLIRHPDPQAWQELRNQSQSCESQGGRPGLPSLSLIACTVSMDIEQQWTQTGQSSHTHTHTQTQWPTSICPAAHTGGDETDLPMLQGQRQKRHPLLLLGNGTQTCPRVCQNTPIFQSFF